MKFIADLHIHSKFSRATAKNLDLENLYIAAQLKGITVVGTGDFTHPGWFSEIREKLVPAEEGLFKLKDEIAEKCNELIPALCRGIVRFILVTEISNIYKKNNKVRKNHNLVFMPDLDTTDEFNSKIDNIGNIKSDGRPILGLDAKDLLEISLETSDQAFLIPAHIWTPWFSVLGSKSGFDSIEECFEDLTPHIFAVETGLSSDPAMNWRVSGLDGFTLVSNSDAHSPLNLGREANLFDTELSYPAIRSAMKTSDPERFLGTYEFYPEEGKYHLDGHRKCDVRLLPKNSIAHNGICPKCGKPLTLGVLYRVEELADRPEGVKSVKAHPFYSIVPLTDIFSEILKVGPKSKKVQRNYRAALEILGPEFEILHVLSTDAIDKAGIPLLGEAIKRMRNKNVNIFPGYDGEYGKVKIFEDEERENLLGQQSLFNMAAPETKYIKSDSVKKGKISTEKDSQKNIKPDNVKPDKVKNDRSVICKDQSQTWEKNTDIFSELNKEQRKAIEHKSGPLLIVAGPGTGKTRTLTHRIAYLIKEKGVSPENILAVTFTNKAAMEMKDRLKFLLNGSEALPFVATFHSLCFNILKEHQSETAYTIIDDHDRIFLISEAIRNVEQNGILVSKTPRNLLDSIISAKQKILGPNDNLETIASGSEAEIFSAVYRSYQNLLSIQGLFDYEDLIFKIVHLFETDKDVCRKYQEKFKYIFVDEYQDLNQAQYRIIKALAPPDDINRDLCVIGDPDQSIYGFRGSDVIYFKRFINDYPEAEVINLSRNYRSTETILETSYQVIRDHRINKFQSRIYSKIDGAKTLNILELDTEKAEAVAIGKTIEQMVGGIGFHSMDFSGIDNVNPSKNRSFSEFAVLYRTGAQGIVIAETLEKAGIPCQIANKENMFKIKGVSELISFLKAIEGAGSYADLERIINFTKPGIGKKTIDIFKNWCYQNRFTLKDALLNVGKFPVQNMTRTTQMKLYDFLKNLSETKKEIKGMSFEKKLHYIVENTKILETVKNSSKTQEAINNLFFISKKSGDITSDFITDVALQTDTDIYDSRAEKVALMTMHAAKGLEFPVVFITGCEKDYIPFKRSDKDDPDINEERRLFYVAMTRAKQRLFLTCAKKRRIYGKQVKRELSPFVEDIEKRLLKYETPGFKRKKKETQVQLNLF